MEFCRKQGWLLDKPEVRSIIKSQYADNYGFYPHYSQIDVIYCIMNTGNPDSILKCPPKDFNLSEDWSIFHLATTLHRRNKLQLTKDKRVLNIFLNKIAENRYINIANKCCVQVIQEELMANSHKFMLLQEMLRSSATVSDVCIEVVHHLIVLHFSGIRDNCALAQLSC